MYLFVFLTDVKVKLSKCPPSIRGNCSSRGAIFLRVDGKCFIFNNYSSMNEIFRSDGRNMVHLVSFNRENFLKIMLFSISRSMHVS